MAGSQDKWEEALRNVPEDDYAIITEVRRYNVKTKQGLVPREQITRRTVATRDKHGLFTIVRYTEDMVVVPIKTVA